MVSLVTRLRAENARTRSAFRLLPCNVAYHSGPEACSSRQARVGDLSIGEVHFRPQAGGAAIVELQDVGPACIRLEAIKTRFPGGTIANACSHVTCRYYSIDSLSDRLSFGLPDSGAAPQCITSVVLNLGRWR